MKKLFAVMLVASAITACNDNTKTESSTKSADSTSMAPATAAPDTSMMKMDSSSSNMSDTTRSKM
ncbi:MAG: hypothetical protein H0X41_02080 [Chitinophagaceae bacterium]|nr:hypothetical protein [Chitinophagaceae bacterium]